MPGPIPKREDDRLGHPHTAEGVKSVEKIEYEGNFKIAPPNPKWVDIASYSYQAFLDSPLNIYYTETDVAFGWMTAQAIHEAITKPTATRTLAAESLMKASMFNEADRRRVRIEITRKEPERNTVADKNVSDFQARRRRSG